MVKIEDTIATDIDRTIQVIKKHKHISLSDLSKETGIPKKTLEKWLPMMEDVGLIKISYHLTQVYVDWVGEEEEDLLEEEELGEVVEEPEESGSPTLETEIGVESEGEEPHEIGGGETKGAEEFEPEIKLSEEKITIPEDTELLGSELESPETEPVSGYPETSSESSSDEIPRSKHTEEELGRDRGKTESKPSKPQPSRVKKIPPLTKSKSVPDVSFSKEFVFDEGHTEEPREESEILKELKEKMKEIERLKQELEHLREEKRKLLETVYEPMAEKFESDLKTISERIADKEENILRLQQKILQLPEAIDRLDRQQLKIKELEEEATRVATETHQAINELLEHLNRLKEESLNQLSVADKYVAEGNAQIADMKSLMAKIESIRTDLENRMILLKEEIEKQKKRLAELEDSWVKLQKISRATEQQIKQTENIISQQKEVIDRLQEQIAQTEQLEQWVRMHQENYNKTVQEFLEYLRENQKEYNRLREALEANFVQRYISDLERLSHDYEFEMDKAMASEKSIDERIVEAKKKLQSLLKQSRALIKAFEESGYKTLAVGKPEEMIAAYERKGKEIEDKMEAVVEERKELSRRLKSTQSEESSKKKRPKQTKQKRGASKTSQKSSKGSKRTTRSGTKKGSSKKSKKK